MENKQIEKKNYKNINKRYKQIDLKIKTYEDRIR